MEGGNVGGFALALALLASVSAWTDGRTLELVCPTRTVVDCPIRGGREFGT